MMSQRRTEAGPDAGENDYKSQSAAELEIRHLHKKFDPPAGPAMGNSAGSSIQIRCWRDGAQTPTRSGKAEGPGEQYQVERR